MTIHLRHAGTSLVLDLLPDRLPVVRHWGPDLGPVREEDLADLQRASATSAGRNAHWLTNDLPVLPLAHLGWSARPAVLLSRADSSAFSPHLDVVEHESTTEDGPAGTTAVLRSSGRDTGNLLTLGTELRLEPSGLVRLRAWVRDDRPQDGPDGAGTGADADLLIGEITPVMPLPQEAQEVVDMSGHHCLERTLQRTELTLGTRLRESWEGRPGHDAATWMAAGTTGFGWRSGRVHGVHLAWSGNGRYLALHTAAGRKLLGAGELLLPGEVRLGPGQTYTTPWTVFSWGEGLDALAHRSHAWLRSLPSYPSRPRPVLLNTWEAVYFDHDLDKLKALAEAAAQVGIERYVLDDGWFGSRRDDTSGLGDWQVSPEAWPQGLEPLVEHVHSLGMEFGLWFEPEMINLDSDLARTHPDWVLSDASGGAPEHRNQRVLDLCAPGAWDYLYESISSLVERLGIDYIKWDHNSPLLATGHATAEPTCGRQGAGAVHDQTLALYRLLDALHERFPELEIESCAGGGGRIDLGILEHTQRVWASDCIDAHDRQDIQRGTCLLLPPELVGTHVGAGRAHTTLRELDLDFRAGTAIWGHMGVEWDLTQADAASRERLAAIIALHKELRPLLHAGLGVHADLAEDEVLRIEGVVAPDGSQALFQIACLGQLPAWPSTPRPLPGLDPSRRYRVRLAAPAYPELTLRAPWMEGEGVVLPGSYLSSTGLALPVLHPDHLILLHLSAVN
ncbi:alpha-galactosidase [Actinomyces capricornis]|uniref:alpha-galactosidase n=1 Tax=Actinomyces capricornis TaxID=2755559 RepID=A0ABM7UDC5_9ACTO|nr:alpha-galactosidase [Actinomyces capricornis]BDA65184.1 alpha-galactosidase [Actinomyces capricornis]